ncbi:MAG: TIGR03960 family B12-binding radical SAM protein [bacterium]
MNNLKSVIFNKILPFVEKPQRYQGNEFNRVVKQGSNLVRIALAFPDTYELGMSYTGFRILYSIINREDDFAAERVFAPWFDLSRLLREKNLPLFSLETFLPIGAFDLVGFTLQYELSYTNILNMLDLSGIPLLAKNRTEAHPLVLAGGPVAGNPHPMEDFIDFFVIGDAEENILSILKCYREHKSESRSEILDYMMRIPGVFVPGRKMITKAAKVKSINLDHYFLKPVVSLTEITHDRLGIEIMRGCSHGCRFCHAGYFYRPVRERDASAVIDETLGHLTQGGWENFSFLSLSAMDYSQFSILIKETIARTCNNTVRISFPSLRMDSLSPEILNQIKLVKKSGLTLAPEAGSQRLRNAINKKLTDQEIYDSILRSISMGWSLIKLYFMIGLPTETWDDIEAIINMVKSIRNLARSNKKKLQINVSIGSFSPKPHTPMQWRGLFPMDELKKRGSFIKNNLNFRNVKVWWTNPENAYLESIMALGGKEIGPVIMDAYQNGALFDGWTENFNYKRWLNALSRNSIEISYYTNKRAYNASLPWDDIDMLVQKKWLINEDKRVETGEITPDCQLDCLLHCGVCNKNRKLTLSEPKLNIKLNSSPGQDKGFFGRKNFISAVNGPGFSVRIHYGRSGDLKFLSHLDITRLLIKMLRMAMIPIEYSQGFHPHPKISFSHPLPMQCASRAEYFDIKLKEQLKCSLLQKLSPVCPQGIILYGQRHLRLNEKPPSAATNKIAYEISPISRDEETETLINNFIKLDEKFITRTTPKKIRTINMRTLFQNAFFADNNLIYLLVNSDESGCGRPFDFLKHVLLMDDEEIFSKNVVRTAMYKLENGHLKDIMD